MTTFASSFDEIAKYGCAANWERVRSESRLFRIFLDISFDSKKDFLSMKKRCRMKHDWEEKEAEEREGEGGRDGERRRRL